jgi:hypothetical protein
MRTTAEANGQEGEMAVTRSYLGAMDDASSGARMHLRREEMQFCRSSLLQRQFASPFVGV